jgi:hypothetical protein
MTKLKWEIILSVSGLSHSYPSFKSELQSYSNFLGMAKENALSTAFLYRPTFTREVLPYLK